jgi:hypothetical protein
MADDKRKGYTGKEEHPVLHNKFYSNADGYVFYDAEPLTEAEKKLVAVIWDSLAQKGSKPGIRVPKPDTTLTEKEK